VADINDQICTTVRKPSAGFQWRRSKHWVKVKNRGHPPMNRVMDALG
jgi:hypothetical protein